MKFSVGTNWQKDLIPSIKRESIAEIYGKLASDFIGGGRPSSSLFDVSKNEASLHIEEAHKNSIEFNYLLNATCLNNQEFTIRGMRKLRKLLDWLVDIGVDAVTVSNPYLLNTIKIKYPILKIYVALAAEVSSLKRAQFWEDQGADQITLFSPSLNRNFELLKTIRKNIKCELQLIANNACLYNCVFCHHHGNLVSHASESSHPLGGFTIDYCIISCTYAKISNLFEIIRSDWIRPEDIHFYENIGINKIKLVDRRMSTDVISSIVKAYTDACYDGNLLDLLGCFIRKNFKNKSSIKHGLRYYLRPFHVNIFKIIKTRKLHGPLGLYVDNRKLDGFIKHFINEGCSEKTCQECGYCEDTAKRVIEIDQEVYDKALSTYRGILGDLVSGNLFRYDFRS